MATRMQQRRGTAAQWISTNSGNGPVLNAGEIGYETDTNKFKIGDGTNHWLSLDYFVDSNSIVNPAFGSSIVFEGATANDFETTLAITDPTADRTITFPDATGTVALTTDITVTASSTNTFSNKSISLASNTVTGTTAEFNTALSDSNFVTTGDTGTVTSTMIADGTIVNGDINASAAIDQSKISGLTTDLAAKAPLAGPALTGDATAVNLTISGNLTVNGTTTNINSTSLVVEDKNVILGDVATPSDTTADGGGITLKGATDKTFNWVDATDAWTSSEDINLLTGKSYEINGTVVLSSTQVLGKAVPSGTIVGTSDTQTLTDKTLTSPTITTPTLSLSATSNTGAGRISFDSTADKLYVGDGTTAIEFAGSTVITNAQNASYTTVLADKDKLIEMNVGSANNLTIPLNSSVAYPIGTVLNIVQIGSGQTTVVATGGVTINATPGLKLRAQYSSASCIKRAENTWILLGDLTA